MNVFPIQNSIINPTLVSTNLEELMPTKSKNLSSSSSSDTLSFPNVSDPAAADALNHLFDVLSVSEQELVKSEEKVEEKALVVFKKMENHCNSQFYENQKLREQLQAADRRYREKEMADRAKIEALESRIALTEKAIQTMREDRAKEANDANERVTTALVSGKAMVETVTKATEARVAALQLQISTGTQTSQVQMQVLKSEITTLQQKVYTEQTKGGSKEHWIQCINGEIDGINNSIRSIQKRLAKLGNQVPNATTRYQKQISHLESAKAALQAYFNNS